MNIYVHVDMEGISGIHCLEQVKREHSGPYLEGVRLMETEINMVARHLKELGAKRVVVCDSHLGGANIRLSEMTGGVTYETWLPSSMMPSLDESFDGVVLLGKHAKAGTLNAFIDHSFSSRSIFDYKVNGRSVGEIYVEAANAACFKVPVILVTGDQAAIEEASCELGNVPGVAVKTAQTRDRATCLAVEDAHEKIKTGLKKAMAGISACSPIEFSLPATIEKTFYQTDMADEFLARTDAKRIDARTVRYQAISPAGLLR